MTGAWHLGKTFDHGGRAVAWDRLGDGEPVVLVHGTPFSSDVWRSIARERSRELATMIPGYQLTEIPGASHLMQEDAPEANTAAALKMFV